MITIKENVGFEGWPNCVHLSNRKIELIVTTDIGPRIIRLGYVEGRNMLYVSAADRGKVGGDQWRIYGGHRLWHSPEVMPRTYCPDNSPVNHSWDGKTLTLTPDVETLTGIGKEVEITLDPEFNRVRVLHRLVNHNLWDVELSAWAITACAAGGKAILPQEPYKDPALDLLPSRPVVLWYFTRMADPRWRWGNKYIQLLQDPSLKSEQKIGILNKQGWAAYCLDDDVLVKRFGFDPKARYEDYGCNNEVYTDGELLEVETLGPVTRLTPGQRVEHTENWMITRVPGLHRGTDESVVERLLSPLLKNRA